MTHRSEAVLQRTIGIDLGDRTSRLCVLGEDGQIEEEASIRTSPKGIAQYFEHRRPSRVIIEVGTHSPWISRQLSELGHQVIVANARRVHLITRSQRKTDRADAEWLARLGRADPELLSPVQHRSEQAQTDRALIKARDTLVATRTQLINHVRGTVKSFGHRLPKCGSVCFANKAREHLPEPLRPVLTPMLELIATVHRQIRAFEKQLRALCQDRYPETALLQQVPGVGPITSLSYVLTLEDPARFSKSRSVGSYLGLQPRQRESGDSSPQLRITKAGDALLRRLLVQAAQYMLGPFGPDTSLRRWGLALAERGGKNAKKRAVVATARKLAVLLHRLWTTGEVYEPLRGSPDHVAC